MGKLQKIVLVALAGWMALLCVRPSFTQDRTTYSDVVFLDQGWSDEDRLRYYNTSQGSAALSYDIFLNLEKATDQSLFRADENMTGYGLVPQPADPKYNPDGLPIGITRTIITDGPWKGEWAGLGCALCHTGQLEYKGTKIRIAGGNSNTLDILAFIAGLDDALAATAADPEKFDRLAEKLRQKDSAGTETLRDSPRAGRRGNSPLPEPDCLDAGRCRTRAHGCAWLDSQPDTVKRPWHSRKLAIRGRTGEVIVCLEHPAIGLGAVERRSERSGPAQCGRSHGCVCEDGPDVEDTSGRAVRLHG